MVKGKAAKKALKEFSKTKFARGAGIAGGARAAEEVVSNPYAQAGLGAIEGAALGAALGPLGAAGGAVAGGLLGFILADGERIVPVDMIAIPAYEFSAVLAGRQPTFQVYIKEGECIKPVLTTDYQMAGQVVVAEEIMEEAKPKRKLNSWQRYLKSNKNKIFYKSGKNKGKLNLAAMSKAYKRGRK